MTKPERLEYMRKRFPQLEQERVDAVLSVTKADIQDEIALSDGFREHQRDKERTLTSDETQFPSHRHHS